MSPPKIERRSLLYIRLAAFLASQPAEVETVSLTLDEVAGLVGAALPANARYPSWWRNDPHKMHSRAWLAAGWRVANMETDVASVTWARDKVEEITL